MPAAPRSPRARRPGRPACMERLESRLLLTSVLTYHYDNQLTGANLTETLLNPANVASSHFGLRFTQPVDGQVYAQPLYVPNVAVPGKGTHNVVFVATQHDSVYAFDADSGAGPNAAPLWHVSFIDPANGVTTVPAADVGTSDVTPEIGITSTPVIDAATGTLYVLAKTKEVSGNTTTYVLRLHALDIATGADTLTPAVLQASAPGTGPGGDGANVFYDAFRQHQRAALVLSNGVVYVASASHGDNGVYHGWVLGYNASTLALASAYTTTPDGSEGGVWMSGSGPSFDAAGNMYLATGNGTFTANTGGRDYGDSVLKLSTANNTLAVADYFTPFDQATLNQFDKDLGSSGVLILPDQPGATPHLAVLAGKGGTLYVVNRDDLGQFNANGNDIVQSLALPRGLFQAPVYFNGAVYVAGDHDTLARYPLVNGLLAAQPSSRGAQTFNFPGANPVVSANGTANGIVWLTQRSSGHAILWAYDAADLTQSLYSSDALPADTLTTAVKFSSPTVADGKVFVGTGDSINIFGLDTTTDLTPAPGALTLSGPLVPGDATPASLPVDVTNLGGSPATGTLTVNVYASADDALTGGDPLVGTATVSVDIAAGGHQVVNVSVAVPPTALPGTYHLFAKTVAGAGIFDVNAANDAAEAAGTYTVVLRFGHVPGRTGLITLQAADADGTVGTFAFTGNVPGPGFGELTPSGNGFALAFGGTTVKTAVSVTAAGGDGHFALTTVTVGSPLSKVVSSLASLTAPAADVSGNLTVYGGIGALTLGDVLAGAQKTFNLGTAPVTGATVTFGHVTDLSLAIKGRIAALTVADWADTAGDDALAAASVGTLTATTGGFDAGVTLAGPAPAGYAVNGVTVAGTADGTWALTGGVRAFTAGDTAATFALTATGAVGTVITRQTFRGALTAPIAGSIFVGGDVSSATLRFTRLGGVSLTSLSALGDISGSSLIAGGKIGTVHAARLVDAKIFSGLKTVPVSGFPTKLNIPTLGGITALVLTGSGAGESFIDSFVAAYALGNVTLVDVKANNGGTPFGFVGRTIMYYTRLLPVPVLVIPHVTPITIDSATDFAVTLI